MPTQIATFYRFVHLPDYEALQPQIKQVCLDHGILGTLLIAEEGVNATLSGSSESLAALFAWFNQDPRLAGLEVKYSEAPAHPFVRLRIRRKREIVTMRQPDARPDQQVGEYVPPSEWNNLISDPEVTVVDVRNQYETYHGTFENAIDPKTEFFWEFPDWAETNLPDKEKPVAMFCTGGIRCEKATAYLRHLGYQNVYHLEGGILKYLEEVDPEESLWKGTCFVFDHRGTVDHSLAPSGPDHQTKQNQRIRTPQNPPK